MIELEKLPNGGIWIPAEDKTSKWIVIALHGSGGSSRDFSGLETILNNPTLNYLFLNGTIRVYSGYRWYSDLGPRESAYNAIRYVLDYTAQRGYPPQKTFLIGFSQGAALAIEFGVRYPHLLAGYIGISGRIENLPGVFSQGYPEIIQKGKWLITHGTKDYNLSVDIIRHQVEQLREGGFNIDYQEYDKIHEFDAKQELPFIRQWILARQT